MLRLACFVLRASSCVLRLTALSVEFPFRLSLSLLLICLPLPSPSPCPCFHSYLRRRRRLYRPLPLFTSTVAFTIAIPTTHNPNASPTYLFSAPFISRLLIHLAYAFTFAFPYPSLSPSLSILVLCSNLRAIPIFSSSRRVVICLLLS